MSAATRVLKLPAATAVSTMDAAARTRTAPRGAAAAQRRGAAARADLEGARSCWVIIRADMMLGAGVVTRGRGGAVCGETENCAALAFRPQVVRGGATFIPDDVDRQTL